MPKKTRTFYVTDGADRGPMTMFRVRFHPVAPVLFGQCTDRRLAVWNLDAEPDKVKDGPKEEVVAGSLVCPHAQGWIRGFDVHPSGDWIATAGSDRRLKLWRWTQEGAEETPGADVAAHDGWVEAVAFSPDGRRVATGGGNDFTVKLWSANDLGHERTLTGHRDFLRDVVWSPDGRRLVSGAEDGLVHVWDGKTFEIQRTIEFGETNAQQGQHPDISGVHRLAVSRDGRWLAVCGDEVSRLYDLESGEAVAEEKDKLQAAFHPQQDLVVLGQNEARLLKYDPSALKPPERDEKGRRGRLPKIAEKPEAKIKLGGFALGTRFSGDGRTLALGKADGTVELWTL